MSLGEWRLPPLAPGATRSSWSLAAAQPGAGPTGRICSSGPDQAWRRCTPGSKAAREGLAREETNLASYSEQLARPFEHDQALLEAQRELARIDRKLTGCAGPGAMPGAVLTDDHAVQEAAA